MVKGDRLLELYSGKEREGFICHLRLHLHKGLPDILDYDYTYTPALRCVFLSSVQYSTFCRAGILKDMGLGAVVVSLGDGMLKVLGLSVSWLVRGMEYSILWGSALWREWVGDTRSPFWPRGLHTYVLCSVNLFLIPHINVGPRNMILHDIMEAVFTCSKQTSADLTTLGPPPNYSLITY